MTRGRPIDWSFVLRKVFHKTGVPPHVAIRTLSLSELAMGCDDNFEDRGPRPTDTGPTEPEAAAAFFRSLDVRGRLNLAKYGDPAGP